MNRCSVQLLRTHSFGSIEGFLEINKKINRKEILNQSYKIEIEP